MAFMIFPNDGQRATAPRASLTKRGLIGFNKSAVIRYNLRKYKRCLLYYDAEEKKIGVELSNDENNPTTLTLRQRESGAEITSRNFFSYFNIMPTEVIVCSITEGKKEGSLVLDTKAGEEEKVNTQES